MIPLRILTFPCADTLLSGLADLGHRLDLAVRGGAPGSQPWRLGRALPASVRPVPWFRERRHDLVASHDLVICHTLDELSEVRAVAPAAPVILRPNPPREALFGRRADAARRVVASNPAATRCVFDSTAHRAAWDAVDGVVVPPALDVSDYGPYVGLATTVLIAGNLLTELPLQSGYVALEHVTAGLPVVAMGFNPGLGHTRLMPPRAERIAAYRRHRLFLNTAVGPFGDAASTWVVEAMATGMPVVTLADAASPIEHRISGLIANDPAEARLHAMELLEDHDLAVRLGRAARDAVARRHSPEAFQSAWRSLIDDVIARAGPRSNGSQRSHDLTRIA